MSLLQTLMSLTKKVWFMIEEIWKDIIGFESWYSVSNKGKVYGKVRGKLINLSTNQGGYLYFMAKMDGKVKNLLIHRQVALSFLDAPSQDLIDICKDSHHGVVLVNHIDGDKSNNSSENLEWTDGFGNMKHASENGLLSPLKSINGTKSKIKDFAIILEIRKEYIPRSRVKGAKALAAKYEVSVAVINGIVSNRTYIDANTIIYNQ